ncbi:MAG: alpha/beta fold hydrolase [candidate division KSB1 bacterium]|nr:alpha/beta fold hydrolase [candidate division KSB1 bacterium]MDZ7275475.1 alpha/beta fold hydrolase [candidate division KSB1 bacterium]MDZ7286213.1 alpha/beta fold hydrolase [candidate division KSB1 bacterium]MDZ7296439.1 alpha/beta fold hydrolase [candidate division KSB1 bacterium]MDZ7307235.1 alpha/beta fold hydrolase [candidate division KSB1 bacterium]
MPPFAAAWWAPGGHAQTLAGYLLPSPRSLPETHWHSIAVSHGDRLVLGENRSSGDPAGMVLLLHGLGGRADSPYMVRVAQKFLQQGWTTFRLNHRGAGQGRGLAKWLYHAGRSEDLVPVIQFCAARAPHQPLLVIGFSLSGNMLLKYLAEQGGAVPANLAGAIAVSAPIQLALSAAAISRHSNALYHARFLRLLKQALAERMVDFPDFPRLTLPKKLTLTGFDHSVTAPLGGFTSAEDYYQKSSAHPLLGAIRTPTILLAAQDDPCVPFQTYAALPHNPRLQLLLPRHGGHLGFIAGSRTPFGDHRWLDYALQYHAGIMCQAAGLARQMACFWPGQL